MGARVDAGLEVDGVVVRESDGVRPRDNRVAGGTDAETGDAAAEAAAAAANSAVSSLSMVVESNTSSPLVSSLASSPSAVTGLGLFTGSIGLTAACCSNNPLTLKDWRFLP